MHKYKTCCMARHNKSIGRFTPTYGVIEANNESEALDRAKSQLEESGLEVSWGCVEPISGT